MPKRLTRGTNRQPFSGHSERWHKERQERVRARRNPVIQAMYSTPEWRALRASVLLEANYICASIGCRRRAAIVDHVKPHRGAAAVFFDRANLQPLCKTCHDRKTARLDGGYGNPLRSPVTTIAPPKPSYRGQGTSAPGARLQGGEFEFLGGRARARLLSRLRTKPYQENADPRRETGQAGPLNSAGRAPHARLAKGAPMLTNRPLDPGAGAPNHPSAPVRPKIRNRTS